MSQLTLSERSRMANDVDFQRRLVAAFKKQAEYWKNYVVDTFEKYNERVRKCKIYAAQIQKSGSLGNVQAIAEYFLSQYNENTPDVDENGNLNDVVLTDSPASAATYEFFAGVEFGDDAKQIKL